MDNNNILEVINLNKIYQGTDLLMTKREVLSGISFSLRAGEVYALIGPNGAGKTTTIKIILNLLKASSGEIILNGKPHHFQDNYKNIGYLSEQPYLYPWLNGEELLQFWGRLLKMSRADANQRIHELSTQYRLNIKTPIGKCSKGMQQKICVIGALLANPRLLILDEPFSGLDPLSRREMIRQLQEYKKNGLAILINSHILSDLEQVADRYGILNDGRFIKEGNIADLNGESLNDLYLSCFAVEII